MSALFDLQNMKKARESREEYNADEMHVSFGIARRWADGEKAREERK